MTANDQGAEPDEPSGGGAGAAPAEAEPAYVSTLAASNSYRSWQWYLDGPLTPGGNAWGANVDAISTEYSGHGARVGIIDNGFDTTQPDLAGRFDLGLSYDPHDAAGATSITPDVSSDAHGTRVAGVLGASAANGYGMVGVAPQATLAGFYIRYGAGGSSMAEIADLLARQVNVDVSNNSWGYTQAFSDNFSSSVWSALADALHTGAAQ